MYRLLALVGRSAPAAGCLGRYTCRPLAPAARPGAPARTSAPRPIGGALRGDVIFKGFVVIKGGCERWSTSIEV